MITVFTSVALDLIKSDSSEFVILGVSCTNEAEDEVEILLEPALAECVH